VLYASGAKQTRGATAFRVYGEDEGLIVDRLHTW